MVFVNFFIERLRGSEQANAIKYPVNVDVRDFAVAICLFFLSVFGVDMIAIGRTIECPKVVVAAKSVPFLAEILAL